MGDRLGIPEDSHQPTIRRIHQVIDASHNLYGGWKPRVSKGLELTVCLFVCFVCLLVCQIIHETLRSGSCMGPELKEGLM